MSLESALQENTKALQSLIELMSKNVTLPAAAPVPAEVEAQKDEVKKPVAKGASSQNGATPLTEAPKAAAPVVEVAVEEAPAITYEQVREGVLKVQIEKGRDSTLALLARHGAKNGKDLKPEQYAKFMQDVEAVVSGEYDPTAAEAA